LGGDSTGETDPLSKRLIGYKPEYDIFKQVDAALAYQAGEDIGVFPA